MPLGRSATPPSAATVQAPSGIQVRLRCGDQSATVVEVGGALRAYSCGDRSLIKGYGVHQRCTGGRGQTMIPWPNRLQDGSYSFGGQSHQLPLTEPGKHNAIHGLVRWVPWSVADAAEDQVTMTHTLRPQSGWPFTLDLHIAYQLGPAGLSVRTTASNVGTEPCPFGTGAHPYLMLGTEAIDHLRLLSPGARWMRTNDRGIPVGSEPAEGTPYDFRTGRPIGSAVLDTAYLDLARDEDGLAWVELTEPGSGAAVGLWMDDAYQYLMLFTGDSLPDPAQRRRALGVEPMTCAPNALRTGDGLRILQPEESFTSEWGISPQPPGH